MSSLLHALPDQKPFARRFKELEVLARRQNALPSTLETLRWFRTQMESSTKIAETISQLAPDFSHREYQAPHTLRASTRRR